MKMYDIFKINIRWSLLLIGLLFTFTNLSAQSQSPPNIKWKEINTGDFRIAFPANIEKEAQRAANLLESIKKADQKSLQANPKPVPLVLFNQTTVSNGYASLAPRMMAWFTTPMQSAISLGGDDWLTTLSIHEYRHIVQYAKNNQKFTKLGRIFFGSVGHGTLMYSIPDWFFEGDAIYAETVLTNGGRGRIPQFNMVLRTNLLENKIFSYDKAVFRSYKHFIPNHYELGYPLITYARMQYGADIWDKVINRTTKYSFWPFAFSRSLKKYTGKNLKNNYKNAMAYLKNKYEAEQQSLNLTPLKTVNNKIKKSWTNYTNIKYYSDKEFICIKAGLDNISSFYVIDKNGKEKKIIDTDASYYSFYDNKICWARTIPDARWGLKDFSDIMIYDLRTKKTKRLTKNKKYFAPAYSPDGKQIAVVEYNEDMQSNLLILNSDTGDEIKKFTIKNNDFIRTPSWSDDESKIVFTHTSQNGMALSYIDLETEKIVEILPYTHEIFSRPQFFGDFIIFNSEISGIGNIYAIDYKSKERYQLTSVKYGAYHADINKKNNTMCLQNYTKKGYDLVEINLKNIKKHKYFKNKYQYDFELDKLIAQEQGFSIIKSEKISSKKFDVQDFSHFKNALNFHSWGVLPDLNNLILYAQSNNTLNTFGITGGYIYNSLDKTSQGFINLRYSKYFPIFNLSANYGQQTDLYYVKLKDDTYLPYNDNWLEFNLNFGIELPLNFSRGNYSRFLTVEAGTQFKNLMNKEVNYLYTETPEGKFTNLYYYLNLYNQKRMAYRDIQPRFAQDVTLSFTHTPFGNEKWNAQQFYATASFWLPGLFRHQSLKISGTYEKQIKFKANANNLYYFSSPVSYFRGYMNDRFEKFSKITADYTFPIWYPDFGLNPIIYFKRIYASVFADYGQASFSHINDNFQSIGGKLMFDIYLLRINYPVSIGVRYSYPLIENNYSYTDPLIELILLGLPI